MIENKMPTNDEIGYKYLSTGNAYDLTKKYCISKDTVYKCAIAWGKNHPKSLHNSPTLRKNFIYAQGIKKYDVNRFKKTVLGKKFLCKFEVGTLQSFKRVGTVVDMYEDFALLDFGVFKSSFSYTDLMKMEEVITLDGV